MAHTQRDIHYALHGARIEGVWLPPIERCADPACIQEAYGVDVSVLAYAIIDCTLMTDDDAIAAAPRISAAYAERMQSRAARRDRIAAGIGESLSGADLG